MRTTDHYSFEHQPGIAIMICEGVEEARSEEEFIAAWKYVYESGIYLRLQGWFGRRIRDMIREGYLDA